MNTISSPAARFEGVETLTAAPTDLNVFSCLRAFGGCATRVRVARGAEPKMSTWPGGEIDAVEFCHARRAAVARARGAHVERAHLMVIAVCSASPRFLVTIEAWLRLRLAQPREERLGVAALFHHSGGSDDANSPPLRSVQRITKEAGCAFSRPG